MKNISAEILKLSLGLTNTHISFQLEPEPLEAAQTPQHVLHGYKINL